MPFTWWLAVTQLSLLFSSVDESNVRLSGVPLSKWETTGDVGTFSQGKTGQDVLSIISNIPLWSCSLFCSFSKPRLSRSGTWWCSRTVKMKWTQGEASVVCIKTSVYCCEKRITENTTSPKIWRFYGSPLPPGNSVKSQDGGEDSESDSSDDSCSSSKFESADFQSSLRSFQMSESKRKRLRELEASAFLFYDQICLLLKKYTIFYWVRKKT